MPKSNRSGQATVLSPEQLVQLWDEMEDPYRLVSEICYFTASRVTEILKLRRSDIQGDRLVIQKANTKTKQTKTAQVDAQLQVCLDRVRLPVKGFLFPSNNAQGHITRQAVDKHVRRAADMIGVQGVSTHSFRRSMATHLDGAGTSFRAIQRITGHNSLQSLERYLDVSTEQAYEIQSRVLQTIWAEQL